MNCLSYGFWFKLGSIGAELAIGIATFLIALAFIMIFSLWRKA